MSQPHSELNPQDLLNPETNIGEIDFLDIIQVLGEEKWLLLGFPFLCACVAAIISLNIPPSYTARATFIVPEKQSSSASNLLDQLGSLGGLAGSLSKGPTETYVALMQSNTVQDIIISEFDLRNRYQTKNEQDTRKKLLKHVKITTDKKSGLISIEAQDQSPDIAAKLANSYLKPFQAVFNRMSLEEAHSRRNFFAQQLEVIAQRPFRDPLVQSTLMISMIKQYEAARIDEARESQVLFPLDVAKSPDMRSSPNRAQLVLIVGLAAFFLTLFSIIIKTAVRNSQKYPAYSQKYALIKKAWKLGGLTK